MDVFVDDREGRVGIERWLPGDEFVKDNPQGVNIAGCRGGQPLALLRRHVSRGADQRAGSGELRLAEDVGDAKIGQHDAAILGEKHIGRLDIAVKNALLMGVIQRRGRLLDNMQSFEKWKSALGRLDALFERTTVDEFHHHVITIILNVKVIHLNDVGVAQRGDGFGLTLKTSEKILPFGQMTIEHLNRCVAFQAGMIGFIYLGHTAPP